MIKLHYTTDLLCGVFQTNLPMLFASGEKSAHSLTIQLREGREPAAIHSQTVKAYFIRSDKSTVFWSGSISGSTVSVTMKESCYVQPGGFSLIIMIGDENDRTAVFWGVGTVVRSATDSLVDPGGQIPSLEALLALIGTIEDATDAAHEATTAANSAASAANTAAGQAIAAANTATSAAGQATSAAGEAHAAAGTANTAAEGADDAAAVAIATAQSIEEMTVAASSLPAGSNPTAEISDVDGHKHVAFGIPAGQTGPKGDTGATPDISIGTVTTGAPGTEASATMTGTSESPVLNLTIPQGNPGDLDSIPWYAGMPSAAGTASPGTSDQVARGDHVHPVPTAAQVGARPDNWMPTAEQVGAYPASGVRSLEFSIAASAWAGAGPYTYTIAEASVTECTWCAFEITSAVQSLLMVDIVWTTRTGQIALSTTAKPTGTITGTVILMEVSE